MLQIQKPIKTEVLTYTCHFHEKNPGKQFAGCTCSSIYKGKSIWLSTASSSTTEKQTEK